MSNMFAGCSSLISLPDISKWNFNKYNNKNSMFKGCLSIYLKYPVEIMDFIKILYMLIFIMKSK